MRDLFHLKYISNLLGGLFVAFCIFTPDLSYAENFYVGTAGNDSNPGTENSPFRNIKHGVSKLSAGDTLYVKEGEYYESILSWQTTIPNGTSWDNPVTVAAKPGETVTIIPPSGHAFFWVQDGQPKYLIIKGFVIDGQYQARHGFGFGNHTSHIRVQNCEIKNTFNSGIHVGICSGCADPANYPNDTYHEFLNLNVHDNGKPPDYPKNAHGFYIETSNNLVENSKFYNNAGNGGKFFHGNLTKVANNNIARYNNFFNNGKSGKWSCGLILSSGDGNVGYGNRAYGNFAGFCTLYRVTNASLYNNISYENDTYGIYVGMNTTNGSKIENNTVYKNGTFGIFVGDGATNTEVINNITYLNANNTLGENIGLLNQTGTQVSHNLTSDPMFKDVLAKDFRLKAESPAVDKGDTIHIISIDFEGTSRPQGSAYDIGAYEGNSLNDNIPPKAPQEITLK